MTSRWIKRRCIAGLLLLPAVALAADPKAGPKRDKPQQPQVLRSYVTNETTRLEQEMAGLIQQHAALAAGASGWLDLRIDSRVISRWICQQLIVADPNSDAQAVAWLRYQDALSLSATLDAANLTTAPTAAQSAALAVIHKATFDLKPADTLGQFDAVLTPFGAPLLAAMGAGKPVDVRPMMPSFTAANSAQTTVAAPPLTLDAMATRVTQLSISVPLRQQLLAAIGAAKQASPDEAEKVTAVLRDAVGLASVLQTNFAVDQDSRAAMEHQLGEAIALFSDPRVRDAGQQRLADLQQYKVISARIGALKLPPDIMQSFVPALNVARQTPESSEKILSAIEHFAAIDAQMATKKPGTATDAASRAAEQQLKNFATERSAFLAEAEQMGGGGAFNVTPDNLADHILKLRNIISLYDLLKNLPQTQASLLALKPRPTGGLEKRMTQAVVHASNEDDAQQSAAVQTLLAVSKLASAWQAAQAEMLKPIPDDVMHVYTGKTWAEATGGLKTTAAELTAQLASGADVDDARLAALGRVPAIFQAVRQVQAMQERMGDLKVLPRWADCDLDDKKMIVVLDTYQIDFSAVAAATLGGAGDDKSLKDVQNRYRGLLAALDTIAAVAPACAKIPADLNALISRLTIASDHTPREATVRNICWTTDLVGMMQAAPDTDTAEVARLHERLLQTLNRAVPALPAAP